MTHGLMLESSGSSAWASIISRYRRQSWFWKLAPWPLETSLGFKRIRLFGDIFQFRNINIKIPSNLKHSVIQNFFFSCELLWACPPIHEKFGSVLYAEPSKINANSLLLLKEIPGIHHIHLFCYSVVILHPTAFSEDLEKGFLNDRLAQSNW